MDDDTLGTGAKWEQHLFRLAYGAASIVGRPFGGIRPRRIYDLLGRRAFPRPQWAWRQNRWGDELLLSPSFHIDRNIILFGTYDLPLHRALERLVAPGMVCLDVGANLGEMSLHMARLTGASGAVYAFEPVPHVFERLQAHIERNRAGDIVHAIPLALSDSTGTREIAFAGEGADNQGLASIVQLRRPEISERATIETITLDEFVHRQGIGRLDLVKADIQGAEIQMLTGGAATLRAFGPDLLTEISPDDLAGSGATSRDLCALIESFGYRIHLLKSDGAPGRRIEAATVLPNFAATNVFCSRHL